MNIISSRSYCFTTFRSTIYLKFLFLYMGYSKVKVFFFLYEYVLPQHNLLA